METINNSDTMTRKEYVQILDTKNLITYERSKLIDKLFLPALLLSVGLFLFKVYIEINSANLLSDSINDLLRFILILLICLLCFMVLVVQYNNKHRVSEETKLTSEIFTRTHSFNPTVFVNDKFKLKASKFDPEEILTVIDIDYEFKKAKVKKTSDNVESIAVMGFQDILDNYRIIE